MGRHCRPLSDPRDDVGRLFHHLFLFWCHRGSYCCGSGTQRLYPTAAFAVFTLVFLFWFRPLAKRYLHKGEDNRVSNADALLGRKGRVVETIRAGGFGRVQIDGDVWKAVSRDDADIPQDTVVTVIDRASTIITVEAEEAS